MKVLLISFFTIAFSITICAQKILLLDSGQHTSIRGLNVVDDNIIWTSGSGGIIGESTDGGKHWAWNAVPGYASREFRDIAAFDDHTAIIIAVAEPAHILKTTDGKTWQLVFSDSTKGMFLDAMDFVDQQQGMVVGDPVNDEFFMLQTADGGNHWNKITYPIKPIKGEAFFAASGTNLHYSGDGKFQLVSGGIAARLLRENSADSLAVMHGRESAGPNSLAVSGNNMAIAGGDFADDKQREENFIYSTDGGYHWQQPAQNPNGYKSCVIYISNTRMVACGTTGVDVSEDGGKNWRNISTRPFHVCAKSKKGNAVYLAGPHGTVAKLIW